MFINIWKIYKIYSSSLSSVLLVLIADVNLRELESSDIVTPTFESTNKLKSQRWQNWIHIKSEGQKNSFICSLCCTLRFVCPQRYEGTYFENYLWLYYYPQVLKFFSNPSSDNILQCDVILLQTHNTKLSVLLFLQSFSSVLGKKDGVKLCQHAQTLHFICSVCNITTTR